MSVKSHAADVYNSTERIKKAAKSRLNRYYTDKKGEAAIGTYVLAHHIVWAPLFHVILSILFSLALVGLWVNHLAEYLANESQINDRAKLAVVTLFGICLLYTYDAADE